MARPKKVLPSPDVEVQVTPEVTPEVAPEVVTEPAPVAGPTITYLNEEAKRVEFTVNPKATAYTVHPGGMIVETL